ncbi:MAG: phosphate signaling complex protein PhoU [Micrococcaceae bacterium]
MRNMFRNELEQIGEGLTEISQMVNAAMTNAAQCLFDGSLEQAEQIIEADSEIDRRQISLDEHAIDIIARQAPVASDLRILVAALRMSSSLERMGDLARHVALLVRLRYPEEVVAPELKTTIQEMAEIDVKITGLLEKLLDTRDLNIRKELSELKERMDELHLSVFTDLNSGNWTPSTKQTMDSILLSRYLERISDHAVSIAAKVSYLETGEWRSGHLVPEHDETEKK